MSRRPASSKLDRSIGSASYLQNLKNRFHSLMANWNKLLSPRMVNNFSFSVNDFDNTTDPVATGIQYTFPSILDGSSFRVPQGTTQNRLQFSDAFTAILGNHTVKVRRRISAGRFEYFARRFSAGKSRIRSRISPTLTITATGRSMTTTCFSPSRCEAISRPRSELSKCRQQLFRLFRAGRLARRRKFDAQSRLALRS